MNEPTNTTSFDGCPHLAGVGGCRRADTTLNGGKAGIAEFIELRWITVQDGPIHYPI